MLRNALAFSEAGDGVFGFFDHAFASLIVGLASESAGDGDKKGDGGVCAFFDTVGERRTGEREGGREECVSA